MKVDKKHLAKASTLLAKAKSICILTGAGISAESGIKTFRDAGGLWEDHPIEKVATPEGFAEDPQRVWRFYNARRKAAETAAPNPAHLALARLEAGKLLRKKKTPAGGSNGNGASGSGSGSGQGTKPSEKLFVPGQPVPGQFENDPTPLGPGQDVPLTPYTQVVQAYQQAALDATDQSLIPGSERDLVREYFSSLGAS